MPYHPIASVRTVPTVCLQDSSEFPSASLLDVYALLAAPNLPEPLLTNCCKPTKCVVILGGFLKTRGLWAESPLTSGPSHHPHSPRPAWLPFSSDSPLAGIPEPAWLPRTRSMLRGAQASLQSPPCLSCLLILRVPLFQYQCLCFPSRARCRPVQGPWRPWGKSPRAQPARQPPSSASSGGWSAPPGAANPRRCLWGCLLPFLSDAFALHSLSSPFTPFPRKSLVHQCGSNHRNPGGAETHLLSCLTQSLAEPFSLEFW